MRFCVDKTRNPRRQTKSTQLPAAAATTTIAKSTTTKPTTDFNAIKSEQSIADNQHYVIDAGHVAIVGDSGIHRGRLPVASTSLNTANQFAPLPQVLRRNHQERIGSAAQPAHERSQFEPLAHQPDEQRSRSGHALFQPTQRHQFDAKRPRRQRHFHAEHPDDDQHLAAAEYRRAEEEEKEKTGEAEETAPEAGGDTDDDRSGRLHAVHMPRV